MRSSLFSSESLLVAFVAVNANWYSAFADPLDSLFHNFCDLNFSAVEVNIIQLTTHFLLSLCFLGRAFGTVHKTYGEIVASLCPAEVPDVDATSFSATNMLST